MATFLSLACEAEEINFFTSAKYTRSSFSQNWATRFIPDTEGLTTAVYLEVLDKFDIPADLSNGRPPGGLLPGIDIKRMDAIQAIQLSMAESLTQGQWWELYEDNQGGVFFQNVFDKGAPGKTVVLDIRLCIPSSSKSNEVDMVIVTGYKRPAERFARPFSDFPDVIPAGLGVVNPTSVSGDESVFTVDLADLTNGAKTCVTSQLKGQVIKSYRDPVVTDVYGPAEINPFYDTKAYESLITYVVDIDGMPTSPDEAARVKYEFKSTTVWYRPTTLPGFSTDSLAGFCSNNGIQTGEGISFYSGTFSYTGPNFTDRYGSQYPLVIKPASMIYVGYTVKEFFTTLNTTFVILDPIPQFLQMSEGSQWVYTVPAVNRFDIKMYYQPQTTIPFWDNFLQIVQGNGEGSNTVIYKVSDADFSKTKVNLNLLPTYSGPVSSSVIPTAGARGFLISQFWSGWVLDRPSVVITDSQGDAINFARKFRMRQAPIILFDPPAPIAYKHKDAGVVKLGLEEQAQDQVDADPATCQNFETTPMQIMQDLQSGNTISVNLPFCQDVNVCATVASTIFDYQNYADVQTYTITCGPDDEPELGAAVSGFDSSLRIQSINYSYQDGSSYTIEVTLGPVFSNVGSWGNGAWIRKTENISRDGIIVYSAGDGTNYRVLIQGLGHFNALNTTPEIWRIGERVKVTLHNSPLEE